METKYPALRRPKRKLCYLTDKDKPSKQWVGTLKLEDVDKIFDDLDASEHDEEEDGGLLSSSPLLHISDAETTQNEREAPPVPQEEQEMEKLLRCQMAADGDVLHPVSRSPSPKLDIDLDVPFKAHGPVKTSSPIESNMVVEGVEELDNEKDHVVSPILFDCEDEGKEEAKTEPLPTQKLQCNRDVTEQIDYAELESPPCNIVLRKPKMSNHKNNEEEEGSRKQSPHVKEKAPMSPQIPILEGQRKAQTQENTARQEPEVAAKKKPDSVPRRPSAEASTRVGKDMTTFLQKLRLVTQSKSACSRRPLSPVKLPTPPEPEDDFLILEDDRPLWFSIPSKTKRQREKGTSSTDKDSSTDKAAKDSPLKTARKEQESEANRKLGNQTVSQKMKKMKRKEKKNEVTETGNDVAELSSPEDLPAGDLMEQEKPNKRKQRVKKAESKQRDKAEEQPEDTTSWETDGEKPSQKKEKKARRSSDMKRSKSLKDGNENARMSRAKSLTGGRKVTRESGAVKDTVHVEAVTEQSQTSEKHADTEDPGSPSDPEIVNSEAQTDEKDKRNKLPSASEESSSEDSRIVGKRKRRPTGQWWLSCPQSTEKTKVTDIEPTLKKSKQYSREPSAAAPSPVKTKTDRVLKRRNQTQPAPSSSQNTDKAIEKATKQQKQNKNRKTRRDAPSKMKASKVSDVLEAEQEQQQEDQDLDPLQSSPVVLEFRDHSHNTGDHVFQKVYHHVSKDKAAITPASGSPRRSKEQLRATGPEKRSRKPPSNWWLVNDMHEAVESISSQAQQQQPKPHKGRRRLTKQSRSPGPGTPKNGNMALLSKPPGGTPVPPLTAKPSCLKTVKRTLATFKDNFTSATETPAVVQSREAGQRNRRKVSARPAVGITVTDCSSPRNSEEDIPSMDAGKPDSPLDHEASQDSKYQSENMLKTLRSGPSSMIELEQYEDNDDLILPSSKFHDVLSISDMCAPPLEPLILEPKDEANLAEWFKSLCSTTVDNGTEMSADQFDWYFYRGRAIGFLVDLNNGSICSGKVLLGSFMKKPLQVDHRAATVFHVITSSVSVTIDGHESRFSPVQSFMVPCGHAYSIQNVTAQPAVLCFTRMLAESSD